MIGTEDVVLAISYSGATEELLRFLPLIQAKRIPIIGMSSNPNSLLAKYSVYHLSIAVETEADPLNLVPTSSTTATLALGDAIACALIEYSHFQPTDFAMLHPGGDLGRKLLARVEDVMFKDNLPIVTPTQTMEEAIEVVTNGKLGVAIVQEAEQLVGIITDGDVRRAMQRLGKDFFTTPVEQIMSKNPKTISKDAKIVEAGEEMNHYSIHTLIVVDNEGKVCGIIDSFSCLPGTRFYH
jgi:arabinose-5-phosphate isomerase